MFQVFFCRLRIIPESLQVRLLFTILYKLQFFIDLKETSSGLLYVQ
jgi:hypothetical protein